METKQLTWVIAHEPFHVFLRAAKEFSEKVADGTNGRYSLRVMGLDEWNKETGNNLTIHSSDREKVVSLVNSGNIDIATTYVETLGKLEKNMFSLGLPFLFEDHGHAEKVLDGNIGQSLFSWLESKTNLKGLAFTYSGGYRIIPSTRSIERLEDFYDLSIGCSKSPVSQSMFEAVQAKPVQMLVDEINQAMKEGRIDAGTTTYARFFARQQHEVAKFINDTSHSLFLTSIVMNKDTWNAMSADDQQAWKEASLAAAKIERHDSLADNARVQAEAAEYGIDTVVMSAKERSRFAQALKSIYPQYESFFENGLVADIRGMA
jgi:TRAP-type C4-dicarboxylate transport system substrate-binding protein